VSYSIQTRGNRSLKGTVPALINPPGPRSCVCVCAYQDPPTVHGRGGRGRYRVNGVGCSFLAIRSIA
jgi:hypothetical protein